MEVSTLPLPIYFASMGKSDFGKWVGCQAGFVPRELISHLNFKNLAAQGLNLSGFNL